MQFYSILRKCVPAIITIGFFISGIEVLADESGMDTNVQDAENIREQEEGWVEVEPLFITRKGEGYGFVLMPYSERRNDWGSLIGFSANLVLPLSYVPDQTIGTYDEIYGSGTGPMAMFEYTKKRNYNWGSIGLDFGLGVLSATSSGVVESSLTLIFVEVGGVISLDNFGSEPRYVPYVGGGGYIVAYKEEQGSSSFNGTTQVAPYVMAGFQVQLDRIDEDAALESYIEAEIQNTFIFVEGRKYFQATGEIDPNFETDFYATLGFKMEL